MLKSNNVGANKTDAKGFIRPIKGNWGNDSHLYFLLEPMKNNYWLELKKYRCESFPEIFLIG